MTEFTHILGQIEEGDSSAAEKLFQLVYDELRQLAAAQIAREKPGHTLQPTALVHEAYVRLVRNPKDLGCNESRGRFFAAAVEAMRRILVEHARRKHRIKHGGERVRVELNDPAEPEADERLLALDDALHELANHDRQAVQIVELRRFAGLNHDEIAAALGITVYQARQKWDYARAWLRDAMKKNE